MVEITRTPIEPGLLMRAVQGVRYAVTGKTPEWFGPSAPPPASAPEGTPPRQMDYPVAYNLNIRPRSGEQTSFEQLRALADNLDVLRVVLETRKDQLTKLPWTFRLRDSHNQLNAAAAQTDQDPRLDQLEMFFRNPDKEHDWATWLRILLEDLFVLDAPTIFLRKNNGGAPYSLEILDGATISRVIDERGRVPDEGPAFRQVIKGVPAVNFEREELIYAPRNPRAHKIFGYGPVEQILMTVNIAIRRQLSQLQFYTEGNVPEAIAGVPETWTVDQIKEFQTYWDSLLEGNTAARRHMKFVPGKLALQFTRDPQLKDMYDDWLARIVCFSFSIPATAFVQAVNRATAQTAQETALSEGLIPLQQWVKSVIDQALVKFFNISDIEFSWEKTDEENPQLRAQINSQYIQMGVKSIDEVRGELGLDPIGMGNAIWAPVTNITFVSDLTDPNKRAALMQQAQPAPAGPPGSGGGDPNDPGAPGGPNGSLPSGPAGPPQLPPPQARIHGAMQALEDRLAGLRQRNEGVRGPAAFPFAQASAKADAASPLAKSISTGTGLVAVDLQAPARNLYPAPAVRRRRRKRRGLGKADADLVASLAKFEETKVRRDASGRFSAAAAAAEAEDPQRAKVRLVMHEFKHGRLKTRGGHTVTDRRQAIAIALSEARRMAKFDESRVRRDGQGRFAAAAGIGAAALGAAGIGAAVLLGRRGARLGGVRGAGHLEPEDVMRVAGRPLRRGARNAAQAAEHDIVARGKASGSPVLDPEQLGPASRRDVRQRVHQAMRRGGLERGIVRSRRGEVEADIIGDGTSVPDEAGADRVLLRTGNESFHGHPGAYLQPPSANDFLLAAKTRGEVHTVYGQSGSVYRYSVPEHRFGHQRVAEIQEKAKAAAVEALTRAGVITRQSLADPELEAEADNAIQHGVLLGLRDKGLVAYRFRLTPADKARAERHKDLTDVGRSMAQRVYDEYAKLRGDLGGARDVRRRAAYNAAVDAHEKGLGKRAGVEPGLDPDLVAKAAGGPVWRAALVKASRKKHALNGIADDHADEIASGVEGSLDWLNGQADGIVDGADNADDAAAAVPTGDLGDRLEGALEPLKTVAGKAGEHVAAENGDGDRRIRFSFDRRSPKIQDAVDAQTGNLIREVTDEQVGQVRTIVGQAMARGEPPATMARRLRDILGLTTDQGSQVERYRAELEALDPGALDRQLRDRRYDSTVNRAIEADQALDPEQIDRMVEAYRRKYTNYRAMTVARTESLRAASSGAQMTVADFMNSDDADGMQVVKTWHSADDGRVRDLHKELNKQEIVGVNTPFKLSDGREIIHPHDPEADPDLTINCRCTLSYRIEPKDVSEDS